MKIRAAKDFWSGLMFIAFAVVAIVESRGYSLGTATRMGPSFFPTALGVLLGGLGLFIMLRSLAIDGEPVGRVAVLPLTVLISSVVLFGVLIERVGLVVALSTVTILAAFAGRDVRPLETVILTVAVTGLVVVLFVVGLGLDLPVWPRT